jgi:glutathione S-transferase
MLLYNSPVSGNCYKVRLLFAHLGLEYERLDVSVVDRSNRRELLGDLNPGLRVPNDGRPLAESNAILWYFGDGTQYVPDDPYERAQVLQWAFFEVEESNQQARGFYRRSGFVPVEPELFELILPGVD